MKAKNQTNRKAIALLIPLEANLPCGKDSIRNLRRRPMTEILC